MKNLLDITDCYPLKKNVFTFCKVTAKKAQNLKKDGVLIGLNWGNPHLDILSDALHDRNLSLYFRDNDGNLREIPYNEKGKK